MISFPNADYDRLMDNSNEQRHHPHGNGNTSEQLPGKTPITYLATPYRHHLSAVTQARANAAAQVTAAMIEKGACLFSPILISTNLSTGNPCHPPQGWYQWDLSFLTRCDQLWVLQLPGWQDSIGVAMEIGAATALGMPIRYWFMQELNAFIDEGTLRDLELA